MGLVSNLATLSTFLGTFNNNVCSLFRRVLFENMPSDLPLVDAKLISLKLTEEHKYTVHSPGRHAALLMPLYPSTVSKLLQLTPAVILAQGKRMQSALEYIHSKNYVHMDVKVCSCLWHWSTLPNDTFSIASMHAGR